MQSAPLSLSEGVFFSNCLLHSVDFSDHFVSLHNFIITLTPPNAYFMSLGINQEFFVEVFSFL